MSLIYSIKRLNDLIRAFGTKAKQSKLSLNNRAEILAHQEQQLGALLAHAIKASPFYKEFYSGIDPKNVKLTDLPILSKKTMMENFDRFVTDPGIKLADLQSHIDQIKGDEYFHGEYRVTSTSGSSGLKGVFVSSRKEWSTALSVFLRCGEMMGVKPRLPNRRRVTSIVADSPIHVTYRMSVSSDVGLMKTQRLDATMSLEKQVQALNEFQPEFLSGYPSILSLLAEEQNSGRLKIAPQAIWTFSEVRTRDMEQNIIDTWGIKPFNTYGLTESGTALGCSCSQHQGIHLFEDLFIVEVVDQQNNPIPDGTPGVKILLTNLFNYSQPLIRYEVSDILTVSPRQCACGSAFRLISSIDGRSDDIIYLENPQGQKIPVHPVHVYTSMGLVKEVKQYQVIHHAGQLDIKLALRDSAESGDVERKVTEHLQASLGSLGAKVPTITIRVVDHFDRDPLQMGKFKMVVSAID